MAVTEVNNGKAFVRFKEIEKSFDGETLVIKNLNLDIAKGEFLVVMENKCIILFYHQFFVHNVNQFKYQPVTLSMYFSTISHSVNYL